jgi:spermidine/putrescine transport system substrate-binding protein
MMFYRVIIMLCLVFVLFSCSTGKKEALYIFNWTDYIDDALIRQFEKENNCKVVYDTYNSNENMLTKLMTTRSAYDLVFPSGDHVAIMIQKELLEPLDLTKIPNYFNLDKVILEKAGSFDPGNVYSIPYFWGTTGLVYNIKHVPQSVIETESWDMISNPFFSGKNKITMLDDAREVIGAALITAGKSPNDTSEEALKSAQFILQGWDANISQFDSDSFKNEIQDGTTWLAQAYNGDALQIIQTNPDIGFILPKEGASLWIDSVVIPRYSEHKELAYKFINFLLDAENGKVNAEYVQYPTPNQASVALLSPEDRDNELIYPPAEYLEKCHMIDNIGDRVLKIDQIWQELRK